VYVSLLLLTSRHWVWELAESYPVKPVAAMIQNGTPVGEKVYTSYPYGRPSLNFFIAIASSQLLPVNSIITGSRTSTLSLLDESLEITLDSVQRVGMPKVGR